MPVPAFFLSLPSQFKDMTACFHNKHGVNIPDLKEAVSCFDMRFYDFMNWMLKENCNNEVYGEKEAKEAQKAVCEQLAAVRKSNEEYIGALTALQNARPHESIIDLGKPLTKKQFGYIEGLRSFCESVKDYLSYMAKQEKRVGDKRARDVAKRKLHDVATEAQKTKAQALRARLDLNGAQHPE